MRKEPQLKTKKAFKQIVGQALQEKVCAKHFKLAQKRGISPIPADLGMGLCYPCATENGERPY
jgi:hypothetical protein